MMRFFHRWVSPWLFVLLAVSAVTGVGYRVGRAWFGLDRQTGNLLMEIHAGEWLGKAGSPFYVLLAGAGLLALVASGAVMLIRGWNAKGVRWWHRLLGAILLLPLTASAVTGILAKWGHEWFGFSKRTGGLLMSIHQGSWLGKEARVYYVLVVGLGLLLLGIMGMRLLPIFARSKSAEQ